MKKLILAISLLAITGTISFAQDKNTSAPAPIAAPSPQVDRGPMQEKGRVYAQSEVDRLQKPLQLTDRQKEAVYSISLKYSMVLQSGGIDKQKAQEMKETQLKTTLTPEQFTKYKALSK